MLQLVGSKNRIAKRIIALFPPHRIYVEPFGGSGAVLLRKLPSPVEVFNDINEDIVALFRVVRKNPKALYRAVMLRPISKESYEIAFSNPSNDMERALRVLYQSFFAFRGILTRVAEPSKARLSGGRFVSAAGRRAVFMRKVMRVARRLSSVIIENRDALEVIRDYDSEDTLFYVDPPYLRESIPSYISRVKDNRPLYSAPYDAHSRDFHMELIKVLGSIKGKYILSGYENDLYERHLPYSSKIVLLKDRKTHVGCVSDVVWTNFQVNKQLELIWGYNHES